MAFPAPSNVTVLDLVPPSCTQACQITSSSFETCEYGICICTEDNASALEDCISCLYALTPTQDIYDAAQGIFAGFEETCSPALNFSLQIISDSSSTGASTVSPLDSSTPSTIASQETSTTLTTLVTSTIEAAPSQTAQWPFNNKQICRAVHRQIAVPSNGTKSESSADIKTSRPGWKFIGAVVIVLSCLTTMNVINY
ncbi:hypothetical protein CVT25_007766 [Psilocybe cyanescens]|uniref:Uncharacterized protein n=1 Tax=Psilocybe cyanescens TaxID=93625 RepID=A0A409XHY4_PSICY|nr:hypothetical protein CVT25_007766 [Psilocybe cyanescens]